jgi:dolichol-phosphate mannosyltransferase
MQTLVVLPTYNEAENIKRIIPEILAQSLQFHVLVVDDRSPDGTGALAESLAREYPGRMFVAHREKKEGLGKAYLFGFKLALEMNAEQIIQMDADFSHPPSLLPKMLENLKNHDFVIASRYVRGGGIKNWGFKRRLLSRAGNLYARFVLHSPIHDLTGGFKAFHRRVIEYLLTCPIDSKGYGFQIDTTTRALAAGFRCIEVPFIFTEREVGVSKMSPGIAWEALIQTVRLKRELNLSNSFSLGRRLG